MFTFNIHEVFSDLSLHTLPSLSDNDRLATPFSGGRFVQAPAPRRLIHVGLIAMAVVVAGTAILVVSGQITATTAITLVFDAAFLAVLALMLAVVRRIDVRVDQLTRRHDRSAKETERQSAALGATMGKLGERVDRSRELVNRAVFTTYQQVEAVIDLRELIRPRAPMPGLRHWALSPDALRLVIRTMFDRRPRLVVECGSGSSSIWLGYAAEHLGTGRIVSLEHDERFANTSRDLVRAHGLEDIVEIRYAPLTPWRAAEDSQPWYDIGAIGDLTEIDLIIVDGPPGSTGPSARYPALPVLLPRCAEDAMIVLDDAHRPDETAVSDRWLKENAALTRTEYAFDKHLHTFTRAKIAGS
jgi:predicted O-methyltransferase YrrM